MIGINQLKDVIYNSLNITVPGPTYIHFPKNKRFDDTFFDQVIFKKRDKTGRWDLRKPSIKNNCFKNK